MNKVKLDEIVDSIDIQHEESSFYLNKKTGKVVIISNEETSAAENINEGEENIEDYPDWQQEIIKIAVDIMNTDDYIELPTKYDIHEYNIMKEFCLSVEDENIKDSLLDAISGKGAFRMFKGKAYEYNILEKWYEYKNEALKQIVIDWFNENKIEFE